MRIASYIIIVPSSECIIAVIINVGLSIAVILILDGSFFDI